MSEDNGEELKRILSRLEEKREALKTEGDPHLGHAGRESGRFPQSATLRFLGDHPGLSAGMAAALLVLGPRRVARWAALALRVVAV